MSHKLVHRWLSQSPVDQSKNFRKKEYPTTNQNALVVTPHEPIRKFLGGNENKTSEWKWANQKIFFRDSSWRCIQKKYHNHQLQQRYQTNTNNKQYSSKPYSNTTIHHFSYLKKIHFPTDDLQIFFSHQQQQNFHLQQQQQQR